MSDVGLMGMHVPGMSWREIQEAAVLAEELGYGCISMGESRIRIGSSIVPVFARSPADLAMTAPNLGRMSEGRFFASSTPSR